MSLSVTRAGFLTSVQDLGRNGFRQFGVSLGGALDVFALRVANLLAGNDESDAGLEITLGGLRMRFEDKRVIAWCGGEFDVRVGSTRFPAGSMCLLCWVADLLICGQILVDWMVVPCVTAIDSPWGNNQSVRNHLSIFYASSELLRGVRLLNGQAARRPKRFYGLFAASIGPVSMT